CSRMRDAPGPPVSPVRAEPALPLTPANPLVTTINTSSTPWPPRPLDPPVQTAAPMPAIRRAPGSGRAARGRGCRPGDGDPGSRVLPGPVPEFPVEGAGAPAVAGPGA